MATTKDPFIQNFQSKCRCCFKKFKYITDSMKITKAIENQIQEITNIQVKIVYCLLLLSCIKF